MKMKNKKHRYNLYIIFKEKTMISVKYAIQKCVINWQGI